jgi:hypothetical protein
MRTLIYELLTSDPDITAAIPPERWVQGSALLNTPERPYGVIRFGGFLRGITRADGSGIRTARLEVWVHRDRGSFVDIDATVRLVRKKLLTAKDISRTRDDGSTVYMMEAIWENDSPDMFDQDTLTNAAGTIFEVVGNGW